MSWTHPVHTHYHVEHRLLSVAAHRKLAQGSLDVDLKYVLLQWCSAACLLFGHACFLGSTYSRSWVLVKNRVEGDAMVLCPATLQLTRQQLEKETTVLTVHLKLPEPL